MQYIYLVENHNISYIKKNIFYTCFHSNLYKKLCQDHSSEHIFPFLKKLNHSHIFNNFISFNIKDIQIHTFHMYSFPRKYKIFIYIFNIFQFHFHKIHKIQDILHKWIVWNNNRMFFYIINILFHYHINYSFLNKWNIIMFLYLKKNLFYI